MKNLKNERAIRINRRNMLFDYEGVKTNEVFLLNETNILTEMLEYLWKNSINFTIYGESLSYRYHNRKAKTVTEEKVTW